jgi:hypothetical protein
VIIHNFRNLTLDNDEDFSFMFKNLDFSKPVQIKGRIDSKERRLSITPFFGFYQSRDTGKSIVAETGNLSAVSNLRIAEGINFDFVTQENKKYHGEFHLKNDKVSIPPDYKENLMCYYLGSKSGNVVDDKQIDDLIVRKKIGPIISVLKGIEPAIQNIQMGSRSTIYVDIGAERLIPINVMGDGMRKILSFLAAVAAMKNGVLLIDEIENGLHYASLSIAWKALFSACKEYNVQIIATTHSYECIEAFSKAYDALEPEGDDIRLFRIEKQGENHKAFASNSKVLKAGIEKEFEVR